MKNYVKTNRILLLLLAAAVVVSTLVVGRRMGVEQQNKSYDIVLDYNELELLAEQSDNDISWWLQQFKDMGITRVGLTEESLSSLMENSPLSVTSTMMDEVTRDSDWRSSYPESFVSAIQDFGCDRFDVLVEIHGDDAVRFVTEAVEARFAPEEYVLQVIGDEAYILLDGTVKDTLYLDGVSYVNTFKKGFSQRHEIVSSKLNFLSLGLMPEKVETIQALGMEIIPRTICYTGHNDSRFAKAVIDGYQRYGISPTYMIAGGEAVIGYDDGVDMIQEYLTQNDITLGLIETNVQRENIMQDGVLDMAFATELNAVRVFSVWDYIQYRYAYYGYEGSEEISNTLFRAIAERNIRLIYFKPMKATDDSFTYITDVDAYRQLFADLDMRLAPHGITRGRASVMENIHVPSLAMLALGLGAAIGGALIPSLFLPMKRKWSLILAAVCCVGVLGAWKVLPNLFPLLASFASAVVFACFAAAFLLQAAKNAAKKLRADTSLGKIMLYAVCILVISVLISLAGGMMTAAPLSSTDYMLEFGIFRGVKLAQLVPLAFFCLLFLSYFGFFQNDREDDSLRMKDVVTAMQWQIPVWALVLLGIVAVGGFYYMARTGHESNVSVSSLEIIMRNDLEKFLLARPRTKEFLVAFPCAMLAVYCTIRRLPFFTALFGLAGTIGLTSVCNTFMHIHTPVYMGLVRTLNSTILGILIGALFIVIFELLLRLCRYLKKNYIEAVQE